MSFVQAFDTATEATEGSVAWLYRDTRGNGTIGRGTLVPDLTTYLTLSLFNGSIPATVADIRKDWARVMAMPFGQKYAASFYCAPSSLVLEPLDIHRLFLKKTVEIIKFLKTQWDDFDSFPDGVKTALLDMAYNLGNNGLVSKFPLFCEAITAQNWSKAAAECQRNGIADSRNQWTRNLFLQELEPHADSNIQE